MFLASQQIFCKAFIVVVFYIGVRVGGARLQFCDLLHGWIKVGWPLRIDILSGFTHAEFSAGT
jgi:hypothetical protein